MQSISHAHSTRLAAGTIRRMRSSKQGCAVAPARAMEAAGRAFLRVRELSADEAQCQAAIQPLHDGSWHNPFLEARLAPQCDLMSRKWAGASAGSVLRLFRDCSAGLGVLPCTTKLPRPGAAAGAAGS